MVTLNDKKKKIHYLHTRYRIKNSKTVKKQRH